MPKSKKSELPIMRLFRLVNSLLNALMTFVGVLAITMMLAVSLTAILVLLLIVHAIVALL